MVEILVDAGAIVDLQNRDGSLLHVAAGRSSVVSVVNLRSRSRFKCLDLQQLLPSATIHQSAKTYAKVGGFWFPFRYGHFTSCFVFFWLAVL